MVKRTLSEVSISIVSLDMVASTHLATEFSIPVHDIPFETFGRDHSRTGYRYNADIFGKEARPQRRCDFIHTFPQKETDALGVYEEDLTVCKGGIFTGGVEVM